MRHQTVEIPAVPVVAIVAHTRAQENQARFLDSFSECGSIVKAARLAGNDKSRHYEWLAISDTPYSVCCVLVSRHVS